jgi:hypothetical protein
MDMPASAASCQKNANSKIKEFTDLLDKYKKNFLL